jgi:hypothetical protein
MTVTPTSPAVPTTITNLAPAASVNNSDLIVIVQNGVTKNALASQLAAVAQANTIAAGNGVSVATAANVSTVSLAALTSAEILVGNASNVATPVAVSGDATLSNTGALTLDTVNSNVGSFTYASVTVNAKGLVTGAGSGTAPINNFNAITGFLPTSISGSNTTAAIQISAGSATDSTNSVVLSRGINSWAASNGNAINGYDGGTTLPNSSTIHIFSANGTSGTGSFGSTSLTPTFPSGYNSFSRRIFSFNTNSSGAPIPYTAIETEGGSVLAWLTTQVLDATMSVTTSRLLVALSVPAGIKVQPLWRTQTSLSTGGGWIVTSGDETDVAPAATSFTSAPGNDGYNNGSWATGGGGGFVTTNTSGQIGIRGSGSFTMYWITRGFKDWRRN